MKEESVEDYINTGAKYLVGYWRGGSFYPVEDGKSVINCRQALMQFVKDKDMHGLYTIMRICQEVELVPEREEVVKREAEVSVVAEWGDAI